MVDSLDLKSSGIYSRGGSSPPEATKLYIMSIIDRNKAEFIKNILAIDALHIKYIANFIKKISKKNKIYCAGNGGSASIANHFVCDLVKGNNYKKKFNLISLSNNIEIITAISNDINYEKIFSFQLSKYASKGDLFISISSSGNSKNIINGIKEAKKLKMKTISFTGFDGGESKILSDFNINIDSNNYGIIEDSHSFIMHTICQMLHNE